MKNLKTKVIEGFKKFSIYLIISGAIMIGWVGNEFKHRINKKSECVEILKDNRVHKLTETSVAINERNELMIINRKDGSYELYSDSIGKIVFKMYAKQIYTNK